MVASWVQRLLRLNNHNPGKSIRLWAINGIECKNSVQNYHVYHELQSNNSNKTDNSFRVIFQALIIAIIVNNNSYH